MSQREDGACVWDEAAVGADRMTSAVHCGEGDCGSAPVLRAMLLGPDASMLERAQGSGNAFIARAARDASLAPGERSLVGSGVAIALPPGMAGLAIPRRRLSEATGLRFANSPGLIDNGYRGELRFACHNPGPDGDLTICSGQALATIVVVRTVSLMSIDPEIGGCHMETMAARARITMLENGIEPPTYVHSDDNGMDLRSAETLDLAPLERRIVPFGFSLEVEDGFAAFVQPRSGLALREGLSIADSPSLVDPDRARKGLDAVFVNLDPHESIHIEKGERIAQLVVMEAPKVEIQVVDRLDGTERGAAGFGSSGR